MQETGGEADPRAVPWSLVVILLALLAMVGTMLLLMTIRWLRRVISRDRPERQTPEEEPVDPWTESARRLDVDIEPGGEDQPDR